MRAISGLRGRRIARSPAHRFGQIIGDALEDATEPLLREFAQQHDLYLDKKGPRVARKGKKKVRWTDLRGNKHDLDYVIERDGTDEEYGTPVAFIETAWRRYTRHSKAKVQEIEGAVVPLVATHREAAPFAGCILAGVFTHDALEQLRSQKFSGSGSNGGEMVRSSDGYDSAYVPSLR